MGVGAEIYPEQMSESESTVAFRQPLQISKFNTSIPYHTLEATPLWNRFDLVLISRSLALQKEVRVASVHE